LIELSKKARQIQTTIYVAFYLFNNKI